MKKAWIIGWKDVTIRLRDRGALLYLLLTPVALTFLMGQVFGRQGEEEGFTLPLVPVAVVNHDVGAMGATVVRAFTENEGIRAIVAATEVGDEAAARAAVDRGETYCCVVVIPAGLSDAVTAGQPARLTVYSDPAQELSATIIASIAEQIAAQLMARSTSVAITVEALSSSGRLRGVAEGQALATTLGEVSPPASVVTLRTVDPQGESQQFDVVAFLAPGLALLFLSFGTAQGARAFLDEKAAGTLARLVSSPTRPAAVLGGKMIGLFLAGLFQFGALLLGSALLFGANWGPPLPVTLLTLVLVLTFTCLGLVLAILARSEGQASMLGSVGSLVMAMVGGAFIPRGAMPQWLQQLGLLTPNAWGSDAFFALAVGGTLRDILPHLGALLIMATVLFALGLAGYRRRMAL